MVYRRRSFPVLTAGAALLWLACSPEPPGPSASDAGPARVTIMTFNAENLFDTVDDPETLDETYLPLREKKSAKRRAACEKNKSAFRREECLTLDWSPELAALKLRRVAESVLQEEGRGPDILVLAEVENAAVLEDLRSGPLRRAGYLPGVLIEGRDPRGIDQAILSRLPLSGKPRLHTVPYKGMSPGSVRRARGILEAAFALPGGETLTVFAVHLPAPVHPREFREQAIRFLGTLLAGLPRGRLALAAGDFNVTAEEDAERRVFDRLLPPRWIAAHRIGCGRCPGTNHFGPKQSWSFLDTILLSKNMGPEGGGPWRADPESVRLVNALPEQNTRYRTPARFDRGSGVSDHWPIALDLVRMR